MWRIVKFVEFHKVNVPLLNYSNRATPPVLIYSLAFSSIDVGF
jgi:hypothetical protein